ncbi:MAG: hypothetical protein GX208_06335 [Firmicutes bacterium]|nr:hypothetical protein [Bacillota bacterium]
MKELKTLLRKVEELTMAMEKASIAEYVALYSKPWRFIYFNFLGGVVRGFGLGIGFTAISALFLYLLGRIASLNLPIVGEFIAEITRIVQNELARRSF